MSYSSNILPFTDNPSRTLPRAGIGVSPLAPGRQPAAVAQTTIRTDFHKPLDVHGNSFAQVSFHHAVPLDDIPDANRFILGQIFHLGMDVNRSFPANLFRSAPANTENVGQTNQNPFIQWQIHSCDSSQFLPPLSPDAACAWDLCTEPGQPFFGEQFCTWRTFSLPMPELS
jgi:hypothetical protein